MCIFTKEEIISVIMALCIILTIAFCGIGKISINCDGTTKQCIYTKNIFISNTYTKNFHLNDILKTSKDEVKIRYKAKHGHRWRTETKYRIYFKETRKKEEITKKIYNKFKVYYKNPNGDFSASGNPVLSFAIAMSIMISIIYGITTWFRKIFK